MIPTLGLCSIAQAASLSSCSICARTSAASTAPSGVCLTVTVNAGGRPS